MSEEETNQILEEKSIKVQASKEQMDKIREILANKNSDSQKLNDLEAENQKLKSELEKQGGKGIIPDLNNREEVKTGLNREYEGATLKEAYANMIDDLRAKGDTETLNKLLTKGLVAFKTNFEFKDPWKDGKSCVAHVLDAQNKRARRE